MEIQWTLVLFTAISGTGAWLFISSVLGELSKKEEHPSKIEAVVAFILLVIGGVMSVLHLKHVDRIFEALNRPTSGIFIEAALIGIMCLIVAIYFIMVLRKSSRTPRLVVAVLGLIVGVVFTYECGASYMMSARAAWDSIALPLSYLGTVATAGTALNLLIKLLQKRSKVSVRFSAVLALGGGIVGVITAATFCIASGSEAFGMNQNLTLWTIMLFVLLVAACVSSALAIKGSKGLIALAWITFIAGCGASIALRVVMWLIGTPILDFFLMPLE